MAQLVGIMQPCKEDLEKIRALFLKLVANKNVLAAYVFKKVAD